MTDSISKRAQAKREERAHHAAGHVFVHGAWVLAEDAAELQAAMNKAAERVAQ